MTTSQNQPFRYRWAGVGDLNAFFGLMLDNVTNLVFLAQILILVFQFPADLVYGKMFPGTAFGVFVGDIIYTVMAFRLAKRTRNPNVTAMPLGLDSPSTIGIAFAVIGPAFIAAKSGGLDPQAAGVLAWKVGMATMIIIGIVKFFLSFVGHYVEKWVPEAGLLGSLAGVGIALLGLLPLEHVFGAPVAGLVALGIIIYALVAKIRLPFNLPSVFVSVIGGAIIYYILVAANIIHAPQIVPKFVIAWPIPTLEFLGGFKQALVYLPIAIPFALLTVIGGINVTASARIAGDSYRTQSILLAEAVATLASGLTGGVAQSTPYIGHPAYKAMGGRAAYTLATGLFIGLGGILGFISFLAQVLPQAALAPILIFVGLDIVEQSYHSTPKRHATAVTMAILPSMPYLAKIKMIALVGQVQLLFGTLTNVSAETAAKMKPTLDFFGPAFQESWHTIIALGNGFIITAMIWGAFTAKLIDREFYRSAVYLLIGAFLSLFGLMHSIKIDGDMYLPWAIEFNTAGPTPYSIAGAYATLAVVIILFSYSRGAREAKAEVRAS
jgi:adenine/guanine/hypoxanthine permease